MNERLCVESPRLLHYYLITENDEFHRNVAASVVSDHETCLWMLRETGTRTVLYSGTVKSQGLNRE